MGLTYHVQHEKRTVVDGVMPYLRVAKIPLCLMVAFSATFGYVMASPMYSVELLLCSFGVFLLSMGAATYNSLQEKETDALMVRTRTRPLVTNDISEINAALQACVLIFTGLTFLFVSFETNGPFFIGLLSVLFYNFVYTKMKAKTVVAIVPGAICGAFPPYIGWLSAGGDPLSFSAAILIVLFVLWQIPHFFLVLLNHRKDYINSVTPNMLKLLRESGLRRVFITWIGALAACMLAFTVIPSGMGVLQRVLICGNAIVLFLFFAFQLFFRKPPNYRFLFIYLNFSIFFIMFIVFVGIVGRG